MPGQELHEKVCVVDTMGWPWCIDLPEPEAARQRHGRVVRRGPERPATNF